MGRSWLRPLVAAVVAVATLAGGVPAALAVEPSSGVSQRVSVDAGSQAGGGCQC